MFFKSNQGIFFEKIGASGEIQISNLNLSGWGLGRIEDRVELKGTKQEIDNALLVIEHIDPELKYPSGLRRPFSNSR